MKRRGKRKPLPADLPRMEIVHELPEHELTCECGSCKHVIGEETSEQLEIIPMQVRVIPISARHTPARPVKQLRSPQESRRPA